MSSLTQVQIKRPANWEAFESASAVLWACLLGDPRVHRFGDKGQKQHGLDLSGYQDRDPKKLVGIQCKCIRLPGKLKEKVVRADLQKAAAYDTQLSEYIITTTAENDAALDKLAHKLTKEFADAGRTLLVRVWGWGTLQEKIQEHQRAIDAFDPQHSPSTDELRATLERLEVGQQTIIDKQDASNSSVMAEINDLKSPKSDFRTTYLPAEPADLPEHAELDRFRELVNEGKAASALLIIAAKEASLDQSASAAIRSRLKALAAHCNWQLGNDEAAIRLFEEAADLNPNDQRGVAARVTAAIVRRDFAAAFDLAKASLTLDKGNEGVVPWMLYAASRIPELEAPELLVPEGLQSSQSYIEALTDFLRSRSKVPDWWSTAREGVAKFPKSRLLRMCSADADLDEFLRTSDFRRTGRVEDAWKLKIRHSTETLQEIHSAITSSDSPRNPILPGLSANLISGYGLLEDYQSAKKVVEDTLRFFPDDPDLILRAAQVADETNDPELENFALDRLGESGADLLLKVLIFSRRGMWLELAALGKRSDLASISGADGAMAALLVQTANIRLLPGDQQEGALLTLLVNWQGSDDQLVVIASTAATLNLKDIELDAYKRAVSALKEDSHIASRVNVAIAAEDREDWREVINALDGYIDLTSNSKEVRSLARAFANDHPVTDRAFTFFAELPGEVASSMPYVLLSGFLHLKVGSPEKALPLILSGRQQRPNSVTAILLEIQVLLTLQREPEVLLSVAGLDPSKLDGAPSDKMKVAQVMSRYGRRQDALEFGYGLVRDQTYDPETQLLYCGLFFNDPENENDAFGAETVSEGVWVKVVDEHGHTDQFVIDQSMQPSPDCVGISDARAVPFLGKRVGDEVVVPLPFFGERRWKVVEIKHRYIHTLHDITHKFNDRHPGHAGFQQFTIEDDNIQPILDVLKRRAEDGDAIARIYDTNPAPISLLGGRSGGDEIGFLEFLESRPEGIRTCVGTHEEQELSRKNVSDWTGRDAVLDVTALWTALRLGALDILAQTFGSLRLAESTKQKVQSIRDGLADRIGKQGGTSGYRNGKYYLFEFDDRQTQTQLDLIDGFLVQINGLTQVSPIILPSEKNNELIQTLTDERHPHLVDPILASMHSGSILISEDANFRGISSLIAEIPSVWLQPVFKDALDAGRIDISRYAHLVVQLAVLRHGHLSLDPATLIEIAKTKSGQMHHVSQYIGDKSAEIKSHVTVVAAFAASLWTGPSVPKTIRKCTGTLLKKLIRFRPFDWQSCLALVAMASRDKSLRHFVVKWCENRGKKTREIKRQIVMIQMSRRKEKQK
jgi:cellulose synthase operon protein C